MYEKGNKINIKITNITPYGAFCRAERADGLIHISEVSDYFVKDIKDFLMLVMKLKLRYLILIQLGNILN